MFSDVTIKFTYNNYVTRDENKKGRKNKERQRKKERKKERKEVINSFVWNTFVEYLVISVCLQWLTVITKLVTKILE